MGREGAFRSLHAAGAILLVFQMNTSLYVSMHVRVHVPVRVPVCVCRCAYICGGRGQPQVPFLGRWSVHFHLNKVSYWPEAYRLGNLDLPGSDFQALGQSVPHYARHFYVFWGLNMGPRAGNICSVFCNRNSQSSPGWPRMHDPPASTSFFFF